MPRACVLLAPGFEEIEAVTVIDVLRRADIDTRIVAVNGAVNAALDVVGSHAIAVHADVPIDALLGSAAAGPQAAWDAVVLPGGMPGAANLRDDERVRALVVREHGRGAIIAAICAAPIALKAAGLLDGRRVTCYPTFAEQIGAVDSAEPVISDGPIITSRGVGTALAFAVELAARLTTPAAAEALAQRMLTER